MTSPTISAIWTIIFHIFLTYARAAPIETRCVFSLKSERNVTVNWRVISNTNGVDTSNDFNITHVGNTEWQTYSYSFVTESRTLIINQNNNSLKKQDDAKLGEVTISLPQESNTNNIILVKSYWFENMETGGACRIRCQGKCLKPVSKKKEHDTPNRGILASIVQTNLVILSVMTSILWTLNNFN